jgi:excisionase family DNA binding protein
LAREDQAVKAAEEFVRTFLAAAREAAQAEVRVRVPAAPADRPPERRLLTVKEAAGALGISRSTISKMVKEGVLDSVKLGRLRRVPLAAIDEYVARLRAADSSTGCEANVSPMGPQTATRSPQQPPTP